ncbi:MAG TPA: metallopeptidase family protein [Thermoanaerobaculales bacterium]|nr:metallopeptidase family protein [Thermoanaerobaculales bacterium]HQL31041.1 metallopeptidase family protein [Thermoanaerobaculales bacterium]
MLVPRPQFEELVSQALDRLPRRFAELMSNVTVQVRETPDEAVLRSLGIDPARGTLLGLYTGVPLDRRGGWYGNVLPDVIVLYRQPLMASSSTGDDLVRRIQLTLLHEIGHHFGFSDAEMHEWELELDATRPPSQRDG